jgi:hypothetical protein
VVARVGGGTATDGYHQHVHHEKYAYPEYQDVELSHTYPSLPLSGTLMIILVTFAREFHMLSEVALMSIPQHMRTATAGAPT